MASLGFVKEQKEILNEELVIDFTECLNYGVVRYKLTPSIIENYKSIIKSAEATHGEKILKKAGIKIGSMQDKKEISAIVSEKVTTKDMMLLEFEKQQTIKEEFTLSFDDAPTKKELQTFFADVIGETWKESYNIFLELNFSEFQELYTKFISPSK